MQVSVEAPSKLERRITVVVPPEKLNEAYNKRISNLAKKAKIDGFRPGKAPMNVVEKRYGDTARQEALSEVIQSSLYAAIHQEKLSPVGVPTVEPKVVLPDQPLEFIATFEILPVIEAVKFELSTLEKHVSSIAEADVDSVIQHLRSQHTSWVKVERPAQEKDRVMIDFRGSIDGVAFDGGQAHDYPIVLGSKAMIPGFEEGIMGMQAGAEKTIQVTFPENYFAKEFAAKQAEFAIKVISVSEANLPEMNEAFIKRLGVKSANVNDLRAEIQKNLERELDRVVKLKLKNQVFDKLLEQNAFDIPKALIEREAQRIHDEVHPNHGHEHQHTDAEMAQFNEAAKRNVALGLLVAEIIKDRKIAIDKERVQNFITNLSSAYEKPQDVAAWYQSNKQALAEIEMQVLEEQVVEKLLEQVTLTEKTLSYQELVKH